MSSDANPNNSIDISNFKLTVYVSFQSYQETIGWRLMDALHKYCERNNKDNFKLVTRLRFEGINERKWDHDFLE